ncbi:hypothetical protein NP233_g3731 [Leucocoprinus birnbaumii]|uniref:Uncharacterized protein n=1 Tax=Leucocoprinus birnbaumii TaxID=56174 RepID=A0AAD5VW04_9AGAR|nr:hypothetical protein NP233_g3731 [Leucocoprinus birnbaumii]
MPLRTCHLPPKPKDPNAPPKWPHGRPPGSHTKGKASNRAEAFNHETPSADQLPGQKKTSAPVNVLFRQLHEKILVHGTLPHCPQSQPITTGAGIYTGSHVSQSEPPPPPQLVSQTVQGLRPDAANKQPNGGQQRSDMLPGLHLVIDEDDLPQSSPSAGEGGKDDALGDGIGDDDVGDDDGNVDDLEEAPKSCRPLPLWLINAFNARVKEANDRGPDGLPPLYRDHRTFWFPWQSSFFVAQSSMHTSPSDLFQPLFFLWDPFPLCNTIPCPTCNTPLKRHDTIRQPRHVIGIDAEFPAHLTHRSALSKSALSFMRSCFQHRMGSKQFSDILRIQYLLAHDELHLLYLKFLAGRHRSLDSWCGIKYEPFLPFDDKSPNGRHGFLPGGMWLQDVYDKDIESHEQDINQYISMLSAEVCAIDYSHKITKHIARVLGEQIFTGLLTVTNQLAQICHCSLVAMKAQSQYNTGLIAMREALHQYGHSQPKLFFTDNMSDKQFLEKCFLSLKEGVVGLQDPKYADLPLFELNDEASILAKNSSKAVNDALSTILTDVPVNEGTITIGFDSKWNVESLPQGCVKSNVNQPTAVVQIAYKKCVYILQIGHTIAHPPY